jgi:thiol-disulfide isomerase/thioredoxin
LESEVFEGREYIDHIDSRRERMMHQSNYKAYKPDPEVVQSLQDFFKNTDKNMRILTLGATWCNTCADVKPTLIRIVESVDTPQLRIFLLGGVKTTMQSTEEDYTWAQRSPPEFNNPKFMVNQIPVVYFFNEDGQCLTRIEKYPEKVDTFEEAILNVARNHLT